MSDPHQSNEVSVTVKVPESKKFAGDAPWIVFRGTVAGVREQVAEAFELEADQRLIDLTMQAQGIANTYSRNPDVGLGAKVLGKPQGSAPAAPAEKPQEPAQAPASKPADKDAEDPILFALKAATTLDEVKTVRAENQQAFTDNPDYLAAWKARGREIKAGN